MLHWCALSTAFIVMLSVVSAFPARADNSMIPPYLTNYRDSLLRQRQDLLNQRSQAVSRLTELETAMRSCDAYLSGPSTKEDRDRLIAARAAVTERINDLKGWLADVQSDLLDVDACLRDCESRMTQWACLK